MTFDAVEARHFGRVSGMSGELTAAEAAEIEAACEEAYAAETERLRREWVAREYERLQLRFSVDVEARLLLVIDWHRRYPADHPCQDDAFQAYCQGLTRFEGELAAARQLAAPEDAVTLQLLDRLAALTEDARADELQHMLSPDRGRA
jgi:hypothetical protein